MIHPFSSPICLAIALSVLVLNSPLAGCNHNRDDLTADSSTSAQRGQAPIEVQQPRSNPTTLGAKHFLLPEHAQIILEQRLGTADPQLQYTTEQGALITGDLAIHNRFADLLVDYLHRANTARDPKGYYLRYALYMGSFEHGAIGGLMVEKVNPVFQRNPSRFLNTLAEMPFLIPSVCTQLGRYFGWEDKHVDGKEGFLAAYKSPIVAALGQEKGHQCVNYIEGNST